jgi:DNA-binding response OmpR family regulator
MPEKKILVVDYDPKSLAVLVKLLKANKFRVVTAVDGKAGYEAFKAERPDLVVLEAMLPKLHGFDLTRKISQETQGHVPIILVTGLYKGPQYRKEATGFGAAEYFEKPVDAGTFIAAIRRLLRDEDDIDEELPGSDAVIEALSRRGRGHGSPRGEAKPGHKGQRP